MMSYECVRLNFLSYSDNPKRMGLQFVHNAAVKEMVTEDEQLFKKLKKFLIYKCILATFHEEYEVKKMIGKGSFAKVSSNNLFFPYSY